MLGFYLSLIDSAQEQQKFEMLYQTYRKQMLLLANSFLHNYHDAEEAVSNAFLGIARNMKKISRIENERDLRNYVLKAARHAALRVMADREHQEKWLHSDLPENLSDEGFLDAVCEHAEYDRVLAAINQLDPRYREVLYEHFVLEFTIPEVAQMLGQKVSVVKQQLVRGKKLLLDALSKNQHDMYNRGR
ncbi:MAG: RNA polymerase sigma factor [Clostridia bacterium]